MPYGNSLSADDDVNSDVAEQEIELPPRPLWVHAAFLFTLLFMALHVYWAVGGTWGLPPAAEANLDATRAANAVVSVIELIGAFWVLGLLHPVARRVPAWLLLSPLWVATALCVSHAVFGVITKSLYLSGRHGAVDFPDVPHLTAEEAADANRLAAVHDLLVFEPCFLVQGVVLAMAGWQFLRTPAARRRWTWSLVVITVLMTVFGAVLSLFDMQVAI